MRFRFTQRDSLQYMYDLKKRFAEKKHLPFQIVLALLSICRIAHNSEDI